MLGSYINEIITNPSSAHTRKVNGCSLFSHFKSLKFHGAAQNRHD